MSNLIGAFVVKKITSYEGTKLQNYYDTLVKKRNYTLVPSYEGTNERNLRSQHVRSCVLRGRQQN